MLLLLLSLAFGAEGVYALFELDLTTSSTSPGHVPQDPGREALGRRLGGGLAFGGDGAMLYTHVRRERWLRTDPGANPEIFEVRVGAFGGPDQDLFPVTGPTGPGAYVGYRRVLDMESSSLGAPSVLVRGHGVELGYMGQVSHVYGDVGIVYYTAGWPRYDRSRAGMWMDLAAQLGPGHLGVRWSLEPGMGFYIGVNIGVLGFVGLTPGVWKT